MVTIVKIQGGLGNQMFQYAYGRSLELSGKKVIFDISFFDNNKSKKDTARDFKLNNFNIETKARLSNKKYTILKIFNKIKRQLGLKVEEFYQSEKYFKNIESVIRKEFTLKNKLNKISWEWQEKIEATENSVSIHIRRGDYVQSKIANKILGVLPLKYYHCAISIMAKRITNPHFFIFSDDIDWVKNNLHLDFPVFYVSNANTQDYEEVVLMSKCKNNIIANSSFSWWGAWLNSYTQKIIISPKNWTKDNSIKPEDIIPKSWMLI